MGCCKPNADDVVQFVDANSQMMSESMEFYKSVHLNEVCICKFRSHIGCLYTDDGDTTHCTWVLVATVTRLSSGVIVIDPVTE